MLDLQLSGPLGRFGVCSFGFPYLYYIGTLEVGKKYVGEEADEGAQAFAKIGFRFSWHFNDISSYIFFNKLQRRPCGLVVI